MCVKMSVCGALAEQITRHISRGSKADATPSVHSTHPDLVCVRPAQRASPAASFRPICSLILSLSRQIAFSIYLRSSYPSSRSLISLFFFCFFSIRSARCFPSHVRLSNGGNYANVPVRECNLRCARATHRGDIRHSTVVVYV